MGQVKGCHLVGMPNRLKRIPDGETGHRQQFTLFQLGFFQAAPEMMLEFVNNAFLPSRKFTAEEVEQGLEKLRQSKPETGYDDVAIESYKVFKKLRDDGTIPKDMRFQVTIPTYANVIILIQEDFKVAAAEIYEEALFRAMRKIQDNIPHEDLAFQLDLAVDTMFWEGIPLYKPWFPKNDTESVKHYVVEYMLQMISKVDQDVELGLHNCYGDMEHRHWYEPPSLAAVTERGLAIFEKTPHPINFFHMPVPKSAMDKLDTYYTPLMQLLPKFKEHGTDVYFGVVQYDDLEDTKKRIEAAKKALGDLDFGVATECGWGRTPPEEIESIMKISTEVSEPVT